LQDEGLERIPVLGLAFDPHVSEAVGTAPVDDLDQNGIVLKELMRGYRLNGRVARPSRVVMAEYRAAEPEPPPIPVAAAAPEPLLIGADEASPLLGTDESNPLADLTLDDIISRTEEVQPAG